MSYQPSLSSPDPTAISKPLNPSAATPQKPCWTCRRSRVICDRGKPTCQKCHKLDRRCLGYTKPLVWNEGVASRGKMMGKTFDQKSHIRQAGKPTVSLVDGVDKKSSNALVAGNARSRRSTSVNYSILVDPLFQSLSHTTRCYINFYTQKLCAETVLHDSASQNPFRELVTLINFSPLILKTILATASCYAANADSYPALLPVRSESANSSRPPSSDRPTAYHALVYKQAALEQLRVDLDRTDGSDRDIITAAISLFVWVELLESGKDTWRTHLDGLRGLAQTNYPGNRLSRSAHSMAAKPAIDPYILDTCVICDVIGTTLAIPCRNFEPIAPTIEVLSRLRRAQRLNFSGCPADLTFLILKISWMCWSTGNRKPHSPFSEVLPHAAEQTEHMLDKVAHQVEDFDVTKWANETMIANPHSDFPRRFQLAAAYKTAVQIYAHRFLPPTGASPSPTNFEGLASQVITSLSLIPPRDPFFKCIIWPAFIAGAETRAPDQREMVMELFQDLWFDIRSMNISNAAQLLCRIWKKDDESGPGVDGGWTRYMADEGADWLFI